MKKSRPKVIALVGPTATGKSDLAVYLAQKLNGEVISADSRQVYKGLDIGSGKITLSEMQGIPHHMLDVIDPKKVYSVALFQKEANKKISEILDKNKLPIICGGTGFYIDALLYGESLPEVKPNNKLRKELEKLSLADLYEKLFKLDHERAEGIDSKNKVRLIRSIEIAMQIGKVPKIEKNPIYDILWLGLDFDDKTLKEKIYKRVSKRVEDGMLKEVKNLHERGLSWKRLESFGLEYRYIAQYLQSKLDLSEMIEKLKTEIWHFAKRQRTWFRRNKEINWFTPNDRSKILTLAKKFLKK